MTRELTDRERQELCGRLANELDALKYEVRMYRHEHGKIATAIEILREYEANLYH